MNPEILAKIVSLQAQLIELLAKSNGIAVASVAPVSLVCDNGLSPASKAGKINNVVQALFAARPNFPIRRRWRRLTTEEKNAVGRFYGAQIRAVEIAEKIGCGIPTVYKHRKYVGHCDSTGCDSVWNDQNLLSQSSNASPKVAQCEQFVHRLNHQVF